MSGLLLDISLIRVVCPCRMEEVTMSGLLDISLIRVVCPCRMEEVTMSGLLLDISLMRVGLAVPVGWRR